MPARARKRPCAAGSGPTFAGQRWQGTFRAHQRWITAHSRPPAEVGARDPEEARFAHWAGLQRARRASGHLRPEYVRALDACPHWSWDADWDARFDALQRWHAKHGRMPRQGAAAADFEERSLNKWARQQEHLLRSRRLTEGRAQALQRWIPWGAGQKDSVWNQSYDSLRNWLRAHANRYPTRANNASKTEKSLRTFADNCRRLYNRSPASDAGIAVRRCELLRALPGWDTFAEQTSWDSNYQRLQEWLRTHCGAFPDSMGTSSTSPEELRLAGWIQRQRAAYHSVPRRAAGLHDDQQG
eukprot:753230-Pyramimonas_sp.AAC.2